MRLRTLWESFIQKDKVRDFKNPLILKLFEWGLLQYNRFPLLLQYSEKFREG